MIAAGPKPAAHGYLVSQFLSPRTNRRSDGWGGSPENRARFLLEIGRALRRQLGPDYPILGKLGARDHEPEGLTLEEGLAVVAQLADAGFDAVELSHGFGGPKRRRTSPGGSPAEREAPFLDFARRAREVTALPLILVHAHPRERSAMPSGDGGGAREWRGRLRRALPAAHPRAGSAEPPPSGRAGEIGLSVVRALLAGAIGRGVACRRLPPGRHT